MMPAVLAVAADPPTTWIDVAALAVLLTFYAVVVWLWTRD
jgi:hypothetical protein